MHIDARNFLDNITAGKSMTTSEVIDGLLVFAVSKRATDIHIDPVVAGSTVRIRIDGELINVAAFSHVPHGELISRLKILSGARTDVHFIPQDGNVQLSVIGRVMNIRISFMPTYHGENAVLRLLSNVSGSTETIATLGFADSHIACIERALRYKSGLVLVVGPTGSGKTTTLRVCLGIKAKEPISVMTLEDPVEYEVPGVRHVHIRESNGVSFASGLRASLRQDPDVIMVGEIRDDETAKVAINTALTGHLVLSTLHTNSAAETLLRLAQMNVANFLIAATLRLVISQRLVRKLCRECFRSNVSCKSCGDKGYAGRTVIAEVLEVDETLREIIGRSVDTTEIERYLAEHNFRNINDDAREKVEWGVTDLLEVTRAIEYE